MIKILIAEATPLIILAGSDALGILTTPAIPVLIPDIVYFNAIGSAPFGSIVPLALANGELVRIKPTDAITQREENAAMEEIIADTPGERIVLLFEDKESPRIENMVPITVSGYAQAVRDMQLI